MQRLLTRPKPAGTAFWTEADFLAVQDESWRALSRSRERDECRTKLTDLGLLAPVLDAAGWASVYCEAAIADLTGTSIEDADLLIVLGGPISVYEVDAYPFLRSELSLLERRLACSRWASHGAGCSRCS